MKLRIDDLGEIEPAFCAKTLAVGAALVFIGANLVIMGFDMPGIVAAHCINSVAKRRRERDAQNR